jgi:hypothetical protein
MNRLSLYTRILGAGALSLALLASCQFGSPTTGGGTEGEGVVGTLVDPSGAPLAGVWVKAYPLASPAAAAKTSAVTADSALTNAHGTFIFPGLGGGNYNLVAVTTEAGTTYALFLEGVIVTAGTGLNLGTDTVKVAGSLTFQVLNGGIAVEGAHCYITSSPWSTVSDSSGTCSVTGLPPGSLQFSVSHPSLPGIIAHFVSITSGNETQGGVVTEAGGTPPAPVPLSPTSWDLFPTPVTAVYMRWTREPNTLSFHLQVARDSAFQQLAVNDSGLTDSTWVIGPLDSNTTYFWRVRAAGASGISPWSKVESFHTIAAPPPPGPDSLSLAKPMVPPLIGPAPGATLESDVATLMWAGDTTFPVFRYRLQVSTATDSLFTNPVLDDTLMPHLSFTTMTRVTPRLAAATSYAWRVTALGPGGSAPSPIWTFVTAPTLTALAPFTLSPASPAHNAQNLPPTTTLIWTSTLPGAVYDLTVSLDSLFSTVILRDSNLVLPQKQLDSLPPGARIYWKVRTRIPANAGTWAGDFSAFHVSGTLPVPYLPSPLPDTVMTDSGPALQ